MMGYNSHGQVTLYDKGEVILWIIKVPIQLTLSSSKGMGLMVQVNPFKKFIEIRDRSQRDSKQHQHSPVGFEEEKNCHTVGRDTWQGIASGL